jgi:hypothetical protein
MRYAILMVLILSSSVQAQSPAAVWAWSGGEQPKSPATMRVEHGGWVYEVANAPTVEAAVATAKQRHREAGREPDIRDFRGVVLAVGPDGSTGMVTASTRGAPVPIVAVYHNGQNATHWAPVEVRQLPTTQRVTPAEQFTRTAPSSTTTNATWKAVCVT